MIISPTTAIKNGWVSGINNLEDQIQPNAIDITIDKVSRINDNEEFILNQNNTKTHRGRSNDVDVDANYWKLASYRRYLDGSSNMYVNLPINVCCFLFTRSTLIRNLVFIQSGLYDSGYKGHVGFILYSLANGVSCIERGSRVGQIMFITADSANLYQGTYNHEKNTTWYNKNG